MRADIHEVEPTGNGLEDPKANEQATNAAKSTIRIDSAQDSGENGDQKVRSCNIRARRIEARHHYDRRQKAKQARQNIDPDLNASCIDSRIARSFEVGPDHVNAHPPTNKTKEIGTPNIVSFEIWISGSGKPERVRPRVK